MVVPLLALNTTVPAGPQISLPISKKMHLQMSNDAGRLYLTAIPVLPGHRRTGNDECRGGAGGQVAPKATGVAGGTVEAARGIQIRTAAIHERRR